MVAFYCMETEKNDDLVLLRRNNGGDLTWPSVCIQKRWNYHVRTL